MLSTEIKEQIVKEYVTFKKSADTIAKMLNIDRKSVYRTLKAKGISSRTTSQAAMKYTDNTSFFNNVDCEKKAYWLGALYADGNVSTIKNGSGQVFLTSSDKEWAESFLKDLDSNRTCHKETHNKFKSIIWKAQITSNEMHQALVKLGCIPKKSLVIRLPSLSLRLMPHFIRGYFDGDGSVGAYKNIRSSEWKILKSNICSGSEEFIKDILKILPVKNKKYSYKGVYILQLSSHDTLRLYNYMYNDATIYLKRKKKVFDDYFKTYVSKKDVQRLQ
jgi:hypothetical protein